MINIPRDVRVGGSNLIRVALMAAAVGVLALTQASGRPAWAQAAPQSYYCSKQASNTSNCTAAFAWRGSADTDLQFSEFVNGDHTIMARFMLQYPNGYQGPMLSVKGTGTYMIGQGDYRFDTDAPKLEINIGGSRASYIVPELLQLFGFPDSLKAGQWEHLALVRGGNTLELYLNGYHLCADPNVYSFCDLSVTATGMPSGTLRLGRAASGDDQQFYGFLDDVAVFKRALSEAEIKNIDANVKRLTGSESGLYAGYTFDDATPSGGALPATLSRPVKFSGVPMIKGNPAFKQPVSQTRDSYADAKRLPVPVQQTAMQLPFSVGQVWHVMQGWGGTISHNGYAVFSWDFFRPGGDAMTCGTPFYSVGSGVVDWASDQKGILITLAPSEKMGYLHHKAGTLDIVGNAPILVGQHLADTGGNQDKGTTNCHLHVSASDDGGTLFPVAFSDYEESWDNVQWSHVSRGVPQESQFVKRLAESPPPPQDNDCLPCKPPQDDCLPCTCSGVFQAGVCADSVACAHICRN